MSAEFDSFPPFLYVNNVAVFTYANWLIYANDLPRQFENSMKIHRNAAVHLHIFAAMFEGRKWVTKMVVSSVMTTDGVLARRGVLLLGPKMAASERRGVEPDAEDGAVLCGWCSPSSIAGAHVPRLSLTLPLDAVAQPDASPVNNMQISLTLIELNFKKKI